MSRPSATRPHPNEIAFCRGKGFIFVKWQKCRVSFIFFEVEQVLMSRHLAVVLYVHYIFKRKHNNEIKYFKDNYIFLFIKENLKKKI